MERFDYDDIRSPKRVVAMDHGGNDHVITSPVLTLYHHRQPEIQMPVILAEDYFCVAFRVDAKDAYTIVTSTDLNVLHFTRSLDAQRCHHNVTHPHQCGDPSRLMAEEVTGKDFRIPRCIGWQLHRIRI